MGSDTEELVLGISSDTRQIMNAIKRLEKAVGVSAGQMEKAFDGVGKGIDKSINTTVQKRINEITGVGVQATKEWTGALADQGKELERMRARFNPIFSTITRYKATVSEIQQAHRLGAISSDEMAAAIQRERQATLSSIAALKQRNAVLADTPAIKGANNFNTANIAAQFQDIGVTAAMGMSPIQIALQQGTQLSAVLNTMGSARGVVAGLGAAFMQVVNPISLATIGVVGLTAAAAQYFMTFMDGSEDTEAALKAQADLIQRVAEKWGDALPSLKAYADEQKRLAEEAEKNQAVEQRTKDIWRPLKDSVDETKASVDDLAIQLGNIPEYQHGVVEVQRAFESLRAKVKDGKAETDDLDRVMTALNSLFEQSGIPIVSDLAGQFSNLADQIKLAAAEAKALADEKAFNENLPKSVLPRLDPLGALDEDKFQTNRANATKSQYQLEQERLARSMRKTGISDAEREQKAIDDVVASLQFEQEQIGRTAVQQRIYNELRRAGVDLNSKAGQQIAELVSKNAELAEAQAKLIKQQQDFNNGLEQLSADAVDALGQVIAGTEDAADAFKQLAIEIVKSALTGKGAYADFFGSLGGGGGGLLGLLFGGGGGFSPNTSLAGFLGVPGYANGTSNHPGGLAIVGEKGPELLNLPRGSQVIPQIPSLPGSGGTSQQAQGIQADIRVFFDGEGNLDAKIERISQKSGKQLLAQYDKGSAYRTARDLGTVSDRGYTR